MTFRFPVCFEVLLACLSAMDAFAGMPGDVRLLVMGLCDGRSLGRFCMMSRSWHRLLTKNGRVWRAVFERDVSSEPCDVAMLERVAGEVGGLHKAFGLFFLSLCERGFRAAVRGCCVSVVGDSAADSVMAFAREGASRDAARGLPHLFGEGENGEFGEEGGERVTLRSEGVTISMTRFSVRSVSMADLLTCDCLLIAVNDAVNAESEPFFLSLLSKAYRMPVCLLLSHASSLRTSSCGASLLRGVDLRILSISGGSIHRMLTREIPRLCLSRLARGLLYRFSPNMREKSLRLSAISRMLARMYQYRHRFTTDFLPEFSGIFSTLGFLEEGKTQWDEEDNVSKIAMHFSQLLREKRKEKNISMSLLEEVLLGAGFRNSFFFECEIDAVDFAEFCGGGYWTSVFPRMLRENMLQISFPHRWAICIAAARSYLGETMFTNRAAIAQHLQFPEAASAVFQRFRSSGSSGNDRFAGNFARYAAVECLAWMASGELGTEKNKWRAEVLKAEVSGRADVRAAGAELKERMTEWEEAEKKKEVEEAETAEVLEEDELQMEEVVIAEDSVSNPPLSLEKPPLSLTKPPLATTKKIGLTWSGTAVRVALFLVAVWWGKKNWDMMRRVGAWARDLLWGKK